MEAPPYAYEKDSPGSREGSNGVESPLSPTLSPHSLPYSPVLLVLCPSPSPKLVGGALLRGAAAPHVPSEGESTGSWEKCIGVEWKGGDST